MDQDLTFELTLRFEAASVEASAALKREALTWLSARGITDFVEGVIDGVDVLVGGDDPLAAFADETRDTTPVSVFDFDEQRLGGLAADAALAFRDRGLGLRVVRLSTRSWSEAWEAGFTGVETARFIVRPVGTPAPKVAQATPRDPRGKIEINLNPGDAFGAGDHATTQACLEALEELEASGGIVRGGRCLDVGTGTGILGIAAAKLGYAHIIGTDIDAAVLREAARNCALNGIAMGLVCAEAPPEDDGPFDLVVANILVPVLHHLMPSFARLIAPQGTLLLAGFIDKDLPALTATAGTHGLLPQGSRSVRGWVALALKSR